jgi:hypothetical protein
MFKLYTNTIYTQNKFLFLVACREEIYVTFTPPPLFAFNILYDMIGLCSCPIFPGMIFTSIVWFCCIY